MTIPPPTPSSAPTSKHSDPPTDLPLQSLAAAGSDSSSDHSHTHLVPPDTVHPDTHSRAAVVDRAVEAAAASQMAHFGLRTAVAVAAAVRIVSSRVVDRIAD